MLAQVRIEVVHYRKSPSTNDYPRGLDAFGIQTTVARLLPREAQSAGRITPSEPQAGAGQLPSFLPAT